MSKKFKLYATIKENAGYQSNFKSHRDSYNNALFLLRGKEIEIETDYLFLNQLNTVSIKDISKNGLRLYFNDIKSLRIENRTFRTIKMRVKKFYKSAWDVDIKEQQLRGYKLLLGIN